MSSPIPPVATEAEPSAVADAPAGEVRQVILVRYKRNLPELQIEGVQTYFRSLGVRLAGIKSIEWGTNISDERLNDRFSHCFTLTFADIAARNAFVADKTRNAFMALLRPKADRVLVLDYVISA